MNGEIEKLKQWSFISGAEAFVVHVTRRISIRSS